MKGKSKKAKGRKIKPRRTRRTRRARRFININKSSCSSCSSCSSWSIFLRLVRLVRVVALTAAGLVRIGRAEDDSRCVAREALRVVGQPAALHADGMGLRYIFGYRQQLGHRL